MSSNLKRKQKQKQRKLKEQRRAARQKEADERSARIHRQVLAALQLDSLYRGSPAYDRQQLKITHVTALDIVTAPEVTLDARSLGVIQELYDASATLVAIPLQSKDGPLEISMRVDLLLGELYLLHGLFGISRQLHLEHQKTRVTARVVSACDEAIDSLQDILDRNQHFLRGYH